MTADTAPAASAPAEATRRLNLTREAFFDWYLPITAGLLPVFLVGMLASALANRLAFAGWCLVFGLLYTLWLRRGVERDWSSGRRIGGGLFLLALAWFAFAGLVVRHGEIFDLGFRAALPALYHPIFTHPATALATGGALAASALGVILRGSHRTESEESTR
ncbi:MAG: hypothetical protein AAF481_12505 [Acidobacteriota bacterium]